MLSPYFYFLICFMMSEIRRRNPLRIGKSIPYFRAQRLYSLDVKNGL